jgi:peptidase E
MELFLTSSVHAVAHDIAKKADLTKGSKLVFITTPAEPETGDMSWLQNDRQSIVDAGWEVTDYTITGKTSEQIEQDLSHYDYLYVSGGQPPYMLEQSQKSGFIPLIRKLVREQNKPYIGTSTGSIICGPTLPAWYDDEAASLSGRECYGFVNFTIAPHWGSKYFKEQYFGARLKEMYDEDQVPLVLLTDRQYVHVQDDAMRIVSVDGKGG